MAVKLSSGMDGQVGGSACYASKWLDYLDPLIEQKITETGSYIRPYSYSCCTTLTDCTQ